MSNALSYSTPKSYNSLPCTLSGLGTCLAPPSFATLIALEQALVDQATLIARDAAPHFDRDLAQHEQLTDKVCTCFEYEELHLTDRHQWLAMKPKEQQWISACHKKTSRTLSKQLCMATQWMHVPEHFHIGMIQDMTNFAKADVDTDAQLSCSCSKAT